MNSGSKTCPLDTHHLLNHLQRPRRRQQGRIDDGLDHPPSTYHSHPALRDAPNENSRTLVGASGRHLDCRSRDHGEDVES